MHLRRSIAITFLSSNFSNVVQFAVTVILSRLLTPSEVGIFSITVIIVNIIAIFRDFGVSSYIQRERDLTEDKIRAALGLLISSSWFLAAVIYLTSDRIAAYYGQPGIQQVLHVLSISFILVPFASFHYSLMARNLEAGKQAIVNAVGTITYAVACTTFAWQGLSYMSMAWANVLNIAATIAVYLWLRPKNTPWFPSFRNWGPQMKFGGGAILGGLVDRIHTSIPDLVLGKVSGPHDVGLYSRANGLVGIFQQIAGPTINYNAVPFIAKNYHEKQPLSPIISKAAAYLTGISWPAFIVTAVFAEEIIRTLYGPKWLAAAPVAVYICIQSAVRMGYSLNGAALTAIGRPYLSAIIAGIAVAARLAVLALLNAQNLVTFAIALCIADIVSLAAPIIIMSRTTGFTARDAVAAHWPSLKVGCACILCAVGLKWMLPTQLPDVPKLLIVSLLVPVTWIIGIYQFKHPLMQEIPSFIDRLLPHRWASYLKGKYFE